MPIFAKTKFVLHEDCFHVSEPILKMNYSGPNPQLAYNKIMEMFRTVIGVSVKDRVQESDFKWDRKGKMEDFKVSWEVTKDMDRHSYLVFRIEMKGFAEQKESGKEGNLSVEINGFMRSEYAQDTIWERSIFYEIARVFWHKVFYHEKREEYRDHCRGIMTTFMQELKSFFALLPHRM